MSLWHVSEYPGRGRVGAPLWASTLTRQVGAVVERREGGGGCQERESEVGVV